MESTNSNNVEEEDDDQFFDAPEDFLFYDCTESGQSDQATSQSDTKIPSPTATLRRRRSLSRRRESEESSFSSITQIHSSKEKRLKLYRERKKLDGTESTRDRVDSVEVPSTVSELKKEESTVVTSTDGDRVGESLDSGIRVCESESSLSFLEVIAGLVIKAIGFQFKLLFSFIRIPFSTLYFFYMLSIDPFRLVKRCRVSMKRMLLSLWNLVLHSISPHLYEWLRERKSTWLLMLRLSWGLFWAIYVCVVLCCLLLFSIVISGILMRYLVKEPLQMKEPLNFDYSKHSPEAYVPVISCDAVDCGVNCKDNALLEKNTRLRIVPTNHKLQATVSLSLPESMYNRNLGVFQIRIDFPSAGGKTIDSLRHPCMLQFKSEPLHLLLTFFKIVPLAAGYISESQNLNVKMRGFTEGVIPTSCLRVVIEQRAEFRPGAGIPELYDAFLVLESELPLLRRIVWYWKKTLFIWIAMMSFMTELMFMVICCRPLIIPIRRSRTDPAHNNAMQDNLPAQI